MTPGTMLEIDRLRRERREILMAYVNEKNPANRATHERKIRIISSTLRKLTGNTIY